MDTNHPNLALIHEFFRIYAINEVDKLDTILAEDIKWHIPGRHPLSGTKHGILEVVEYFDQLNKATFQASPIVMGVSDSTATVTGATSKAKLTSQYILPAVENRNGKIEEVYNFPEDQHKADAFFGEVYGETDLEEDSNARGVKVARLF
ncbi:nuclear transport factor 2 family protein [Olivibacter domesticus]|uniref:SnoaL-like domain-containing protein n=1 Tax=Olivibacter domesticus TaxID=407022 RepID=A0A1H7WPB1_OLID1|nr:hypothetical protein [Olivibacter domesticus]SEM23291.1 hypothetical protein SAMN05661044_04596 [Olivibacter domesticus]